MFITKKHISRRTVLRAMGASVSLPFLEAMLPAATPFGQTAAASASRTRLACIEIVHGSAGSTKFGLEKNMWSPAADGRDFDLTPTSLSPLEPFREYLTIVSNTDVRNAEPFELSEVGGDHFRSSAVFLSQARTKVTEGSDVYCGTTLDQLYAQRFGQDTPIPSIQLCIENNDIAGGCLYGYACAYRDTISWASPTDPLPMTRDPRMVFDQLFGSGGTLEERASRRREDRSVLDWITREVARLKGGLGPSDRNRLTSYLEDVREIERRMQKIEAHNASGEARELPDAPIGVPDSFTEHVKVMFDLQALAFMAGITRVSTFKMGKDGSARVYPDSGSKSPFHPLSHHNDDPEQITEYEQINRYHVSLVAYFLEKLRNTPDGDGNLLDHSLVLYGSPMGDSNIHNHKRCPLFLAGLADGRFQGNLHFKAPAGTPMANAFLTALHRLGFDDMKGFGDSTGEVAI